jgi:polysaccharide export outer membrane protein
VLQLPLEDVIRHPEENVSLRAGDVITALYQPLHVTVMGATTQTKEIDFEASGISLAQALARAGGLNGNEADAKAIFVFRLEKPSFLTNWPEPLQTNAEGEVPVVFRFDFSNPATLFAAQEFPIQNKDLIYVASAPITDLQKFLGLIVQIVYPIQGLSTAGIVK